METKGMKICTCPACGAVLEYDGMAYRCEAHGLWYVYSTNLLIHAPSGEHMVRDRFTMPWEAASPGI
jgi:hypothetical protein